MKSLKVRRIDATQSINNLNIPFQNLDWHLIDQCPWKSDYAYQPNAKFQIAHNDDFIFLHYAVDEEFVKAQYIRPNENVWEDSCVEFFISFDNKQTYYNFEFNVLGTGLIGYGPATKSERNRLNAEDIEKVDTYTQVLKVDGHKVWNIYLSIPKSILGESNYVGRTFHANFYKCGDGLPNPHFIAWNNIDYPTPNFHLPEFFGEITFE